MSIKVMVGAGAAAVAVLGGAAYLIFGKDIFKKDKKADQPAPKNEEKKEPEKTEEAEE